ncbi:MAG: OmpA family protein, partial [Pseudomonadota bacterium]
VSVSPGRVSITAITDSAEEKARLEARLNRAAPPGLRLSMDIAAPRPVITPFTLRFVMDEDGARCDACSADSVAAQRVILDAASAVGLAGQARCTIGMGVPSPRWSEAVATSIGALGALGAGSVTFSDADITLTAAQGTAQSDFDRIIGELEAALPDVFAVYAVLPQAVDPNAGPPEFTATLSPEGQVQLRGRLSDEGLRTVADSYAKSRFGVRNVYMAARVVEDLPANWPVRVLAGLEALSNLSNGVVRVTPDVIAVSGSTGDTDAASRVATLLADKLGESDVFEIDITYLEKLDPVANIPTPDECEQEIGGILTAKKINFEPGSATIDSATLDTMDRVAEVLIACGTLRLEIQGHTDSQGREEMNLNLSQARAQSVLNELRARRVPTSSFVAKGYGESRPIQPNDTDEGREANRRIEFRLIRPTPSGVAEPESTLESVAESADTGAQAEETE